MPHGPPHACLLLVRSGTSCTCAALYCCLQAPVRAQLWQQLQLSLRVATWNDPLDLLLQT